MTIALVVASIGGMVIVVVAIATVATRRRRPSADVLPHRALQRVVERHERERVGKQE